MPNASAPPSRDPLKFLGPRHLDTTLLTPHRSRYWYILSAVVGALPILLALASNYWHHRPDASGYAPYALPLLLLPPCALALFHGVTGAFGIWSIRKSTATIQVPPSYPHAPSFLGALALAVLLNVIDLCSELDQISSPEVLWEQHLPAPEALALLAAFYLSQTLAAFFTWRLVLLIFVSNLDPRPPHSTSGDRDSPSTHSSYHSWSWVWRYCSPRESGTQPPPTAVFLRSSIKITAAKVFTK